MSSGAHSPIEFDSGLELTKHGLVDFEGDDMAEKVKKKKKKYRLEEGFEDNHHKDTINCEESAKEEKKKKRKRNDSEEEEKISNSVYLVENEVIENGAAEKTEKQESSAKSKSKEKRRSQSKEREADSSTDAGNSLTDHKPLKKKQKELSFSNDVQVFEVEEMKDEGIENGAGEETENLESSAKSKSKEKRRKKPKDREAHSGSDVGKSANSSTDQRALKKKQKKVSFSNHVQVYEIGEMKDEGIENGAGEETEILVSSAKSKSKEKRRKKPKEREANSGSDVDKSGNSQTDHRPLKKKQKKVSSSNHVEVCEAEEMKDKDTNLDRSDAAIANACDGDNLRSDAGITNACDGDNFKWGRFTKEEDQKIRDSVIKYIKERGIDENEGLNMVLNCQKYPKFRNCWKEIGSNLPWRSYLSVYCRAHVLHEQSEDRCWTKDEIDFVKSFQAEHGKKWSKLAKILGKSRYHVKDTWRRIRRGQMNEGKMSQEEYQRLFDLVNYNLRLKASQVEEKPTRRKVRKNINWEAIADKMETRDHAYCCKKWYSSLTSSMVSSGEWQDGDDFILLRRLLETNAFDDEAVEWDDLLDDRSGEICRKRWKQMEKHIGEHHSKPFLEKLELLVRRYAPELLE